MNQLRSLQKGGKQIMRGASEMENIARNYFEALFESKRIRDTNHILSRFKRCISNDDNAWLTKNEGLSTLMILALDEELVKGARASKKDKILRIPLVELEHEDMVVWEEKFVARRGLPRMRGIKHFMRVLQILVDRQQKQLIGDRFGCHERQRDILPSRTVLHGNIVSSFAMEALACSQAAALGRRFWVNMVEIEEQPTDWRTVLQQKVYKEEWKCTWKGQFRSSLKCRTDGDSMGAGAGLSWGEGFSPERVQMQESRGRGLYSAGMGTVKLEMELSRWKEL
ncbi:hypothetical protein J1N35_025890 [Gossypium stocksii]|uniref:Uncharacterized protein n=1 Tax=Gossypium stocksii TaxID=47602 RepID=A0A9D3ZXL2_9ROSI|nr:hypothetical protein J1N35_025890 [Gossypium stocksii]